jgi:iron complex transport system substrate-binding protein
VEDSLGRAIVVPQNPQRIVVLNLTGLELIRILGAIDRVVGTARYNFSRRSIIPEVKNITNLGSGFTPDMELLVKLKPDLVIGYSSNPGQELEKTLESLGIPIIRLDFNYPTHLEKETRTLAKILGGEAIEKAERFLSFNKDYEMKLQEKLSQSLRQKPTVIVEYYYTRNIAGKSSSSYWTTTMAGGDNLAKFIERKTAEIDSEWVVQNDPEYIIKTIMFMNPQDLENPEKIINSYRNEVLGRKYWETVKAIKNKKVFVLDEDISGGPRNIIGLYTVASWFYPEIVSPEEALEVKKEYFKTFHNITLD